LAVEFCNFDLAGNRSLTGNSGGRALPIDKSSSHGDDDASAHRNVEGGMRTASSGLERFVDEAIWKGSLKGYVPSKFITMREELGTVDAMSALVRSGDVASGFKKLRDLGMLELSMEAAMLNFPHEFADDDRACALTRLTRHQR